MPCRRAIALTALILSTLLPGAATACSPRLNIFTERPAADGAYHYVIGHLVGMRRTEKSAGDGWVRETYSGKLVGHRIGPNGPEPVNIAFEASGQDEFSYRHVFRKRHRAARMFEVRATPNGYRFEWSPCGYGNLATTNPEVIDTARACITGGPCNWSRRSIWLP